MFPALSWGAVVTGARALWNSKIARTVVISVVAALVLLSAHFADVRQAVAKEREKCKQEAQRALVVAQEANRKMEVNHAQQIQSLQTEFARQQQQAASVDARAAADLGSGARRLRFPVASRCPAAPATTGAPRRADATAPADIAPETAAALYSIAADGDEAIRQLTALQEWARDAVRLCGGKAVR